MKNLTILLLLSITYEIYAQFPEFKMVEIDYTGQELLGQSSLVDLDNDSDLDLIVGASGGDVWWFENLGQLRWKKHLLGVSAMTDKGGVAFDVDGDGWIDQVSGQTWYKNNGNPAKNGFTRYDNTAIFAYDNIAGDINGDEKPDLLSMSEQDGLYWYNVSEKPSKKWKGMEIGEGVSGGIYPAGIADIDGDGDNDVVRSNLWFDNIKGDGSKWTPHRTISFVESTGKFANSSRTWAMDFDNDGDMDIVQAESNNENGDIAWHANKDGKGINWFTHKIAYETEQDLHTLCIADFDGDGDMDIFSGAGQFTSDLKKKCYIWENLDGIGESWKAHEILSRYESTDAVAGDVDGDGDIDICLKTWKGDLIYMLVNLLK